MSKNQLKIIPVNKTVVFYSPVEGEDVLVRTGTIEEGSSLFHALLHAYSKDYTIMNRTDRIKFIRRLKASLVGHVDRENWVDTFVTLEPLNTNVTTILTNFYSFLTTSSKIKGRSTRRIIKRLAKDTTDLEVYKILMDLLPLDGPLEGHILPLATSKTTPKDYIKTLIRESEKYIQATHILDSLDPVKAKFISDTLVKFLAVVTREAEDAAFKDYVRGLELARLEPDNFTMDFITKRLDRDIVILRGDTRLPIENSGGPPKGRKTIILLRVDDNHYEIVGKLLPGNRIQREFDPHDIIVVKIQAILNDPQEAAQTYPDLAPHVIYSPRRRSKSHSEEGDSVKDSEEDESDPYYDESDSHSSDGSISD